MFENEKLGCKFSLPDPLCLRDVERYENARDLAREEGAQFAPAINWVGAVALIEDWECEELPDCQALSPDALADSHGPAMRVVMWVGSQVATHVMSELFIPKN